MVLATEGLGPQPFQGRIAVLINEFTHSAAERDTHVYTTETLESTMMDATFAKQRKRQFQVRELTGPRIRIYQVERWMRLGEELRCVPSFAAGTADSRTWEILRVRPGNELPAMAIGWASQAFY